MKTNSLLWIKSAMDICFFFSRTIYVFEEWMFFEWFLLLICWHQKFSLSCENVPNRHAINKLLRGFQYTVTKLKRKYDKKNVDIDHSVQIFFIEMFKGLTIIYETGLFQILSAKSWLFLEFPHLPVFLPHIRSLLNLSIQQTNSFIDLQLETSSHST